MGDHPGALLWGVGEDVIHENLTDMVPSPLLLWGREVSVVHWPQTPGTASPACLALPEPPARLSLPPWSPLSV